ncbi:hypothetical protein LJK88_28170 [Paenibacillus sp. P26]|nr:hypothetical protein LJK88_28170 [Paenibacillus sp. P26]
MAGSDPEQIKADLKLTVDRSLNETKGNILLRIPNPFLTVNPPNLTLVSPIEHVQLYSDQLWDVYESFKNYNTRVDIIDIPSLVFGRQAMPEHPFMHDTLHPNGEGYRAIADALVDRITGKTKDEAISQSFAQETPVNKTIAILREEKLYNGVPYEPGAGSAFSGATIAPQTVQAVARLNGYYKIKTWLGEKWINPLGGILEITPASEGETLQLTENTFLLDNPYAVNSGREGGLFLTPQQVKVLGRWKGYVYWDEGEYYRIQTWLGPKWINLKYSFPGGVEPTTETIEVSGVTDLNKYPWPDSYELGKIAPQKVTAFEMADGWYHIHSWAGDAWIKK